MRQSVPDKGTTSTPVAPGPVGAGDEGAVGKAVDILIELHAAAPRGVSALARSLGLPKSSVHRLLQPLVRRGLVERDDAGRYRPGFALVSLGLGALESEPLVAAARPVLDRAAAELGETCFLVAPRRGELAVLAKAEGNGFLRAAPRVGSRVPVHATAVGKLLLGLAPELLGEGAGEPGEAFTARTVRDAATLARQASAAAERGFAVNRDEWIAGLSVLAVPVRHGGRPVGALALAVAGARLDEIGEGPALERLRAAARSLEARLAGEEQGR